MKKINGAKFCWILSILLCIGFFVQTSIDYMQYDSMLNSAPFSVWIFVNAICFLLPAGISWFIGIFLKKRAAKT